jgi:hypothetical protein
MTFAVHISSVNVRLGFFFRPPSYNKNMLHTHTTTQNKNTGTHTHTHTHTNKYSVYIYNNNKIDNTVGTTETITTAT